MVFLIQGKARLAASESTEMWFVRVGDKTRKPLENSERYVRTNDMSGLVQE